MSRPLSIGLALLLGAALVLAAVQDARAPWRQSSPSPVEVRTVLGGTDRCPTCHRGALGRSPLRRSGAGVGTHPRVAGHPDLTRFGCTPCHGGQGRRLDLDGAHGPGLGGGGDPFLERRLRPARCARCHVPGGALAGAPALGAAFRELLDAACNGCHQPGRRVQGLGPDLRRLGRRSEAELRRALLEPQRVHPASLMQSLRWRYDERTVAGRERLAAILVALVALADSPLPYRAAWARPTAPGAEVGCGSCHQGPRAGGAPHRCAYLLRQEALRCPRCHGTPATSQPTGSVAGRERECPQVRAARPTCEVCHLR